MILVRAHGSVPSQIQINKQTRQTNQNFVALEQQIPSQHNVSGYIGINHWSPSSACPILSSPHLNRLALRGLPSLLFLQAEKKIKTFTNIEVLGVFFCILGNGLLLISWAEILLHPSKPPTYCSGAGLYRAAFNTDAVENRCI